MDFDRRDEFDSIDRRSSDQALSNSTSRNKERRLISPPPEANGDEQLERSLGLLGALAIGIGTMIGAGIFVFPGIAAGRAGMAATLSFGLGAVIALIVALATSELATAMPESGGGYYFVSRGLGFFWGTIVGLGQWFGLVFASAFYLAGFGHYFRRTLVAFGVDPGIPAYVLGIGMGVLITLINVFGTENSGGFQNLIVTSLLLILLFFLGYGVLNVLGFIGKTAPSEQFAPEGYLPVFTTAALVFTSYLGFGQIATVAGEISEPSYNLPLAMVGSVLVVGVMYVTAVFVSTRVFGSARLAEFGETAMVEVARSFFGKFGALGMTVAGLLATVSSANASVLSSSRALYALSKDRIMPRAIAKINRTFNTPHRSLLLTSVGIIGFLSIGGLELLAEVASLLHLVMYGLMCFSLVWLAYRSPDWYEPDFFMWGRPYLPAFGGVCSFLLIGFMNPRSIQLGFLLSVVAVIWYFIQQVTGGRETTTDGVNNQ
ncbi:MAG: APC family permease [bacterium]